MDTVKPCCQSTVLEGFHVRHYERICFLFGQGLCQPLYDIPQVGLYVRLVRKLNNTNYMELRREYRRKLDIHPEAELLDSRLLKWPMYHNYETKMFTDSLVRPSLKGRKNAATKLTDTRGIPAQIVRNDTATKLTDSNVIPARMVRNDTATKLPYSNVALIHMVRNDTTIELTDSNETPAQIVRNDTATKLTDSIVTPVQPVHNETVTEVKGLTGVPVQMVSKDITKKMTAHYSSHSQLLGIIKPGPKSGPKAWTRYKCTGPYCDTKLQ